MARGVRQASIVTGANVATAAAGTAKSVLAVIAAASDCSKLVSWGLQVVDANTASWFGYVVEVCRSTQATAGTSTAVTPAYCSGASGNVRFSGAKAYTVEPTVLTVVEEWPLDPNKGWVGMTYGQGDEIDTPVAGAVILRLTVPSTGSGTGNVRGYMRCED